ncbi:MAG TPA: hypothetical protein PKW80_00270 [Bacteroidales bacterium]|nr:hypothetical protein [Bacteroidales bacterium]
MKKIFVIAACVCMLAACGGGGESDATNDTIVSPELKEIQKTADDVNAQADQLNEKADSLLNNI